MAADEAGAAGDEDRATFAHLAKKEIAKTKRFPLLLHPFNRPDDFLYFMIQSLLLERSKIVGD
jgi:hypothetical protein